MKKLIPNLPLTLSLLDLLHQCCSDDEVRELTTPDICKINFIDGRYHATNGYILVSVPKDMIAPDLTKVGEWQGLREALSRNHYTDSKEVSRAFTLERLLTIPTHPRYGECKACGGEGQVECDHCGNESDCETCDGSGQSKKIIGEVYHDRHKMKLGEIYLNPILLEQVCIAAHILQAEKILIEYGKANEMVRFTVGELQALIMPIVYKDESSGGYDKFTEFFISETVPA